MAHAKRRRGPRPAASRRSTSPSIRSKARTCARPARRMRSRCSPRRTRAACCTRPISTWRSWSSGRARRTRVSLDAPVHENLKAIASCLGRDVEDLVVIVLDRDAAREADRRHPRDRRAHPADRRRRPVGRHRGGGRRLRRARGDGHRRRAGRRADGGRDALPQRRDLRAPRRQQARARGALPRDGHHRLQEGLPRRRISRPASSIIFAATGVTDGTLMRGVRFFGDGIRTSSVIMQNEPHQIRFIDSIHVAAGDRRQDPLLTASARSAIRTSAIRDRDRSRAGGATSSPSPPPSFMGFTGFTLVMPFLPLFIGQLGVTDVGADRDVDRPEPRRHAGADGAARARSGDGSAIGSAARSWSSDRWSASSCCWRRWRSSRAPWHVLALRAVQGLFAGYGSLSVAMAAESAPRDRMPQAIGAGADGAAARSGGRPGDRRRCWPGSSACGARFS